jgi:hypothetical protein
MSTTVIDQKDLVFVEFDLAKVRRAVGEIRIKEILEAK